MFGDNELLFVFGFVLHMFSIDQHRPPTCRYATCLINTSEYGVSNRMALFFPPHLQVCYSSEFNDGHVRQCHPE